MFVCKINVQFAYILQGCNWLRIILLLQVGSRNIAYTYFYKYLNKKNIFIYLIIYYIVVGTKCLIKKDTAVVWVMV